MITGLLNNIQYKIQNLLLKKESALYKDYPEYKDLPALSLKNKQLFEETFKHYVSEVSIDTMAISLELASALYTLCVIKKPKAVLDLGSGYSSFVLRYYQKNHATDCKVYSVDDDAQWLEKTKSYLVSKNLSTDHVYTIDNFKNIHNLSFDLILHDMNFVEIRQRYLEFVFSLLNKNGLVLLDDVHKPEYMKVCIEKNKHQNWPLYSLQETTKDKFNRFSIIVVKPL